MMGKRSFYGEGGEDMRFLFQEDSQLYGCGTDPNTLPQQTRQVGELEDELRIYMEDYVYTYLKQLARGDQERLAVLVGRDLTLDGAPALLISGAIQGRYTRTVNGLECFTPETWADVDRQMQTYFPEQKLVGWMHGQPGFGTFLAARDEAFHAARFAESYQVLFLRDPTEQTDAFYVTDPATKELRQAKGYFLYYEENPEMETYMTQSQAAEETPATDEAERPDAAGKIRTVLQKKETKKAEMRYTLLTGVSGLLCLACLAIAATLYTSQARLQQLENQVTAAYALAQEAREESRAVFAAQGETLTAQTETTDTAKPDTPENQASETGQAGTQTGATTEESTPDPSASDPSTPDASTGSGTTTETTDGGTTSQSTPAEDLAPVFYTVQEGDTLTQISWRFFGNGAYVEEIMALNGLTDPDTIYYGKELQLPQP